MEVIMSTFYGVSSDSVSTLFSSLSSSSSSSTSLSSTTSMLSDYYSIRSGSYKKLLNAYYSKYGTDSTSSTSSTTKSKTTTTISTDSNTQLSQIKSNSGNLQESATALLDKSSSSSLFKETVSKDEDGNEVKSYDMDKIYKGVTAFVDNYNATLETASKSSVSSIQRGAANMVSTTKANSNLLNQIGITIDSNKKLSVDETKLKSADVSTIKTLFNTTGSYGYYIGTKASEMNASAVLEASKTNTYTSTGSYSSSISTGDLYDSLF
jgi:hypothetical protein